MTQDTQAGERWIADKLEARVGKLEARVKELEQERDEARAVATSRRLDALEIDSALGQAMTRAEAAEARAQRYEAALREIADEKCGPCSCDDIDLDHDEWCAVTVARDAIGWEAADE